MAYVEVLCPECQLSKVVKYGKSGLKQRYQCRNEDCDKNTFLLEYSSNGYLPDTKNKIIEMAMNGSGIRDTARVLGISINTVLSELKKIVKFRNDK